MKREMGKGAETNVLLSLTALLTCSLSLISEFPFPVDDDLSPMTLELTPFSMSPA